MKRSLLLAACVAAVGPVHAHQLWVNATQYHTEMPKKEQESINAGVAYIGWGHLFPTDSMPEASKVAPTLLHLPDGATQTLERSEEGFLTAPLTVDGEGAYVLTSQYESGFFTMYREDGEVKHALTPKDGIEGVLSSQYFEMTGKALVLVGEPENEDFTTPTGQTIEIVPLRNPYGLQSGPSTKLSVRVLLRGAPASEAYVAVYHEAHVPGDEIVAETETDAEGTATVTLDRSGTFMIVANVKQPLRAEYDGKADEESYTATLTFQMR